MCVWEWDAGVVKQSGLISDWWQLCDWCNGGWECVSAVNDGRCSPWVMCSCSVVSGNQIHDRYLIKQNSWKIISLRNISGYGCNNGSLRKERGALSVQWWCYGEHLSVIASEACEQLLQSWYGLFDHYVHQHCPGSYKRHSGQSSGSFWLAEASRS